MYTLYSRPGSGGFVAEAALAIARLPFRLVDITRENPTPEFLNLSPLRQVPVLTLPDGRSMTESAAMVLYIADLHPESGLAPAVDSPERPEFLRWLMFLATALYPTLLRWFYSERGTADPGGRHAVKQAAVAEADRYFLVLDRALEGRQWLAGDRMSIADVYLLMLAYWHPVDDKPRPEWVNVVRLCEAVQKHPAIDALRARHKMW
jgi:glutathione S-transferase